LVCTSTFLKVAKSSTFDNTDDDCEQAQVLCTPSRAKKVVVGLTLLALTFQAIDHVILYQADTIIFDRVRGILAIVFHVMLPATVFVINAIVVREVRRRASSDAANNLGLQHHQSTSSNSVVPTVMLVTTSFVYVLLNATPAIIYASYWIVQQDTLLDFYIVADDLWRFVFAYNFYVYLITGKQFRSELHKLFRCRRFSSTFHCAAATVSTDDVRVARHGQADTAV